MNVLCTGHVPRAVGRGGSGVLNTPPPSVFFNPTIESQVPHDQPENLGAKSFVCVLMPVLIYTPVDEQAPSVKTI